MAIIRTSFDTTTNKDLLKEGSLRKIFDDTQREAQVFYKEIVNDLTTKDEYLRDQQLAGLTAPTEISEGQNIPIQSPVLGAAKTYTQRQWGTGFRMTWKMDFFNKYNLWKRWSKDLAKVMKEGKDIEVHVMFNSPTSTLTCGKGFDTQVLAYATHTGLATGTADNYNNLLNAALSYSALESARYYFRTLKDSLGILMSKNPTHLVFEPTLYTTAMELMKSDLKPHEESNTTNVLKNYIKLYEDPRLTSTTMWFMIDKSDGYDINVFTAKDPDFVTQDAPDTSRDRIATSMTSYVYGWGDARSYYLGKA